MALAGNSIGLDPGGWFHGEIGAEQDPKSISHEHTFNVETADVGALEATLAQMSEKVGRRVREHGFFARTIQLKLRYSDFSIFTQALTLNHATQTDTEIDEVCSGCRPQASRSPRARWICSTVPSTST